MRRIALHEYLNQIEGLLDDNRLPEAAAHCHFILQQYPRHIGAYRLFGRSLLEQQLYDDAIDVFERILSADPEDLVSHAGLALAYSESRDLDRAIWHMERAFELDPYNQAVQDELRKLYVARNGDAPPRLALTRAALARLHIRTALFQQANVEFRRLISANPDRTDLKLALADTLYLDSRVAEAGAICRDVIESLPFCIKANAILADAWLREERVDEAREHLRYVQALTMLDRAHLDVDTTLGRALSNSRITLPESVPVEVLEDTLALARGFEESGEWQEQVSSVIVDGETAPDWLQEIGSPGSAAEQSVALEADQEPEPTEFIDWLDESLATEMAAAFQEQETPSAELAAIMEEAGIAAGQDESAVSDEHLVAADEFEHISPSGEAAEAETELASERGESLEALTGRPNQLPTETSGLSPGQQQVEGGAGDKNQERKAPGWDERQLLALDELRAYIDEDSLPDSAEGSAPEWLDELTEREDVTSELPSWLYEAVGLDAKDTVEDQLPDSQRQDAAAAKVDDLDSGDQTAEASLAPENTGVKGVLANENEDGPDRHEDNLSGVSSGSDVPNWLLEGGDVLDELPAGLMDRTMREAGEEETTLTWLDELSAQLTDNDDSGAMSAASSTDAREDELEDESADATDE